MEFLGYRVVKIARLNLPSDFRARLEHPRVAERAGSIKRLGVLQAPIVRHSDLRLISGCDRVAASVKCGALEIEARMVECTDEELYEIEVSENAHRRHSPDEQRAAIDRLVKLYEEQIVADPYAAALGTEKRLSAKTLARKRVAAEIGVKPDSIRRAEYRSKKNTWQNKRNAELREEANPSLVIHAIGMELDEKFGQDVVRIGKHLGRCDAHIIATLKHLTAIKDAGLPFPTARLARLYEVVQAAGAELRAAKPSSVCPYCKGVAELQEACTSCVSCGWINLVQANNVPRELWQMGETACVAVKGGFIRLSSYLEQQAEPVTVDELE